MKKVQKSIKKNCVLDFLIFFRFYVFFWAILGQMAQKERNFQIFKNPKQKFFITPMNLLHGKFKESWTNQ